MTVNARVRELTTQFGDEPNKRLLLCRRARVLRVFAVGSATADIADADRVGVMPTAMRTHLLDGSAIANRAVKINHIVITDTIKATLFVPSVNIGNRIIFPFGCC